MPDRSTRSLVVMRHAKAEPFGAEDDSRRLTPVGESAARRAGRWLRDQGLVPDHAWVSAAVRTQQTWETVAAEAGFEVVAHVEASLYTASPESLLELVRLTPDKASTVIVVGHNPTMAYLSHLLDDGHPEPGAWAQVSAGFPPASMAVFDVPVSWADLGLGTAHLRAFGSVAHGD